MEVKKPKRCGSDRWNKHRKPLELNISERVSQWPLSPEVPLPILDELGKEYGETGNPVYVWDAILQIECHSLRLGRSLPMPPWVHAYLYRVASEIMGRVVAHEGGKRQEPQPRDELPQLAPDERVTAALEALLFTAPNQHNAFERARKLEKIKETVAVAEERALRRQRKKITAKK